MATLYVMEVLRLLFGVRQVLSIYNLFFFCQFILITFFLSGCTTDTDLRTAKVNGRILDSDGVPIESVQIKIDSPSTMTTTDALGRFEIEVEVGPHWLAAAKNEHTLLQVSFVAEYPGPTMLGDLKPTITYYQSEKQWYKDADHDGYSDGSTIIGKSQPATYYLSTDLVAIVGDCDDMNAALNPRLSDTCGHDELIELYIQDWYRSKVVDDSEALLTQSSAVNWEQFDRTATGELIAEPRFGSTDGWILSDGSEITNGELNLPPRSSARSVDLPVISYDTTYWIRLWVKSEGGEPLPGPGFRAQVIRRAADRSFISRKNIPPESDIHPIPTMPNGSDWVLMEAPLLLTEETKFTRLILENLSEGTTFRVKRASISEFSMLDIQNDGSMAMPLIIERGDLPKTHSFKVNAVSGPSGTGNSEWSVTANGDVLPSSVTENPDGSVSLTVEIPEEESQRLSLLIDKGNGLRGYGQVGIINQLDSLLIGFATDQHYSSQFRPWAPRYRQIVDSTIDQINAHRPDLVFFIGDNDEDNQPLGNIFHDYGRLRSPLVIGHGNHEKDNQDVRKVEKYLSRRQTYFDFVIGDYHFILIDGNELSGDGGHENTIMSQEQLAWLDDVLNNSTAAAKIVVSEPAVVFRNGSSWQRSSPEQAAALHNIFATTGVTIVVQGDKHQYDYQIRDGVKYLTLPSVTRPFLGDLRAGYGMLLLQHGDVAWANMIETFEQDPSDSHPPVAWSMTVRNGLATPSGHLPVFYYKKPTLQIRRFNEILEIEAINHLGVVSEVPIKLPNGGVQLFQIPDNGSIAIHDLRKN